MSLRALRALTALLAGATINALQAQTPTRSHLRDRLQVSVSGAVLTYATDFRIDAGDGSPGTELDPEDDLGMPSTVVQAHFGVRFRPGRRHELEFGYLLARRAGDHVLTDTIIVGDTTFAAGLRTESDIASDNATLTYRFAFHLRARHEIGATIGLGTLLFRTDIKAVSGSTSAGPDTTIVPYAQTNSLTVPTAALGLYGRMQAGQAWYFEADARALFFTIERITVNVIDVGVSTRYFVSSWLGLQAAYTFSGVSAAVDPRPGAGSSFSGRLKYGLHAVRIGIVATK